MRTRVCGRAGVRFRVAGGGRGLDWLTTLALRSKALVPLALVVLHAVTPVNWAPAFAALCGWLAHLSYDRAFGYGLRTKEGYQRG